VHDGERGRVAHVVGVGLEGQSETRCGARDGAPSAARIFSTIIRLWLFVGADQSRRSPPASRNRSRSSSARRGPSGSTSRETRAGGEELVADPAVETDAESKLAHVGADRFAKPRDLVMK